MALVKTYQDLIGEARNLLQDTDTAGYRWTDALLVEKLNRGLQEAARMRPDMFYDVYDANDLNVPVITDSASPATGETAWTTAFPFEAQFYPALVSYVVAVTELTDDEFTVDGRAGVLYNHFRQALTGV